MNEYRETQTAVEAGALEIDMVINHPLLKQQSFAEVYRDIAALSADDIIAGCTIAAEARADFVKTSTGFNGQGATRENVRLMKAAVGDRMKVKASGGVKTVDDCLGMLRSGAERIGTSSGVQIMKEAGKNALIVMSGGSQ